MQQRVTRVLFEYWDALRGSRPAPHRGDVDPGAIRSCLADTFVLTFAPEHGHPFRIAGTSVCAMFGSELTRTPFDRLWAADQQPRLNNLIGNVTEDLEGMVAGVTGRNADAETVELEMILLPLSGGDGGAGRVLGALTVVTVPYWLGTRPLATLSLGETRYAGAERLAIGGNDPSRGRGFVIDPGAARRISRSFHG